SRVAYVAFGDVAAAVDDDVREPRTAFDPCARQDEAVVERSAFLDRAAGEQHGAVHAAGDDAPGGDDRARRGAARDEARGRAHRLMSPEGPRLVGQIERRLIVEQIQVRAPVTLDRADVAPV